MGGAAQLLQLREADEDSDEDLEDVDVTSGVSSVSSQLRQMELVWSSLLVDVPVVQQALHKVRSFSKGPNKRWNSPYWLFYTEFQTI